MKKILSSLLVFVFLITAFVAVAPEAKADDCGYWATRYEQVYVPPSYLGVDLQGRPVYSPGYFTTRAIPYYVYRSCAPMIRIHVGGYRHHHRHHHHHARHRHQYISIGFGR